MKYITEYNKYNNYNIGDEVLIHYWWKGYITPVKIIEKVGKRFLISNNIEDSYIQNAPDMIIKKTEIIDVYNK